MDTIESNIEHAQVNVHEATQELGRVSDKVFLHDIVDAAPSFPGILFLTYAQDWKNNYLPGGTTW